MAHYQLGDWVIVESNEAHGIMTGQVKTILPSQPPYQDWLYEVEVTGKLSRYWYESQLSHLAGPEIRFSESE